MLVVHGVWAGDGVAFWAEDTALAPRAARGPAPRAHPWAAPVERLPAGGPRMLELLLPGSAAEPLPSPETGLLSAVTRPSLRPWRVPAVVPPLPSAVHLLTPDPASAADASPDAAPGPDVDAGSGSEAGPGLTGWGDAVPGATVRHWRAVAAFARDLVRRGRVVPQLELTETDGEARAAWRAVVTGADAAYFRDLALTMPPACRTWAVERPSHEVLRQALDAFADTFARTALNARPPQADTGTSTGTGTGTGRGRWLAALTSPGAASSDTASPDATSPGAACPDDPDLRRALEEWRRSVESAEGATRVCFRLTEPVDPPASAGDGRDDAGGEHRWRVELAVQAADDPSLYVPAGKVWGGGPVAGLPAGAERELLAGLGRAVRLYPELDRALRVREPEELVLDTAGAFAFLREAAPLLQAAGFGVQLPRWAGRARLGLKVTTRTKTQSAAASQGFGLRELVDFRVDLAVGGETIGEEELAELARLKVPLVRVRGQWVELDERQLAAALRAVGGERAGVLPAAEVLRHVVQGDDELPLLEVDADGVLGELLSGRPEGRPEGGPEGRPAVIGTPPGLDGTLRPYQERGLAWLSFLSELGLGGVLADDMGLGKTVTTLALLVHEQAAEPTLLVCPMSLVGNWQREAARFAPDLRVHVHHGSGRDAARIADADLVITTYGTAQRDLETLRRVPWRRVVCDEAQAIKNSGTLQAQAVRSIPAGTRLALTGTPVENHLAELWSIMEFANPGLLGPKARFRTRFQEPIEARQDEQAAQALRRATGPFILRRLKADASIISDLPEKLEVKEWCTLTPEQASLYQAVVDDMLGRIDDSEGIERRGLVLAAMAKLKQVCNHPAHLLKDGSRLAGRSGKLARLEQLAEEILAEGEKALLFTQYAEFGSMLQPYLEQRLDRPVLWLHGGLPKKARDRLVDRFQQDDEPMLFLLSLKAAGVGLNLTAASHVVHVDRWWNPAVEDQATDRAFRIGQRRNVQVRKLICAGTLEERVDEMIERKKALAERVVGAGEDWLTDLSTGELREVFRLTAGAVG
ncbi:SNF2-related protein [Nonomuraea sp. NPDC003214]